MGKALLSGPLPSLTNGGKGEEKKGVKGNASIYRRDGLTGVKRSTP